MRSLSETFNVNYFLVSQTNPHIVPLLNLKKRVNRKLGNVVETEWKHRRASDTATAGRPSCCRPCSTSPALPGRQAQSWLCGCLGFEEELCMPGRGAHAGAAEQLHPA